MNVSQTKSCSTLISLGLAAAVVLAYLPLWHCGFVNFDDPVYVTANPALGQGLSWAGLRWAFTTAQAEMWHPVTWFTYLFDHQFYGENPTGYHVTSLLFHLANAILFFRLLLQLTKELWPSAMVAALFALHPLHVESVAWVAERKDVVSTLFWILSVGAYARYVDALTVSNQFQGRPLRFYALSLALFVLGLMAKPMLVTLPFILLLLDFWPLRRAPFPSWRLVAEKVPFLVFALAASVVAYILANQGGSVAAFDQWPLGPRVANAFLAYARYLGKTIWPVNLSVFYPYGMRLPLGPVLASAGLLVVISTLVVVWGRTRPWLPVGWLWFLGMLLPVIGLIQNGSFAMADRFTYLPNAGLFIMAVWSARELGQRWPRRLLEILTALVLALCGAATYCQAEVWRNTETLFRHAYAATGQSGALSDDLGRELLHQRRFAEAIPYLQQAVAYWPEKPEMHNQLADALLATGQVADGLEQLDATCRLAPDNAGAQLEFGTVLLDHGLAPDAIPHLEKARQLKPGDAQPAQLLAMAYTETGRTADAISQYEFCLKLDSNSLAALNNLAWLRATASEPALRDGPQALSLAQRAMKLQAKDNPAIVATLAAAYAETGQFDQAIANARAAIELIPTNASPERLTSLRAQLAQYEKHLPWRGPNEAAGPNP